MSSIPVYVSVIFILTTFLTAHLFYKASRQSNIALLIMITFLTLEAIIGLTGFFVDTKGTPPRFIFLISPPLLLIAVLFISARGKRFIDYRLNQKALSILHVVRIPVELCLYWLFLAKTLPELMTFTGRNYDILAGLTAPIIYYFGYVKGGIGKNGKLTWNIISLCLLIFIVANAALSLPSNFQQIAFDQPNIAVLYFPYLWLPGFVVPVVLFSHLATIRQLIYPKEYKKNNQSKKKRR